MRKTRKTLSLMVALVFLFSQCLSGIAFADTHSISLSTKDVVKKWVGTKLEPGYQVKFTTSGSITKAELASLLVKAFNLPSGTYQKFSDVSSKAWYKTAVGKATLAGIMSSTGKFHPYYTMSRQIGATIIYKAFRRAVPTVSDPKARLTRIQALQMIDACTNTRITSAGTYTGKTYKNVVISQKSVVMKNAIVNGNLLIAQGVGTGDVTLDNVIVKGSLIVLGGGLNGIKLNNSNINSVLVDKKDGKVRLLATGTTSVGNVIMNSGGKLEEDNMTVGSEGFTSMTVTKTTPNAPVILDADLTLVSVEAPGAIVKVLDCKIGTLTISPIAKNAYISLENGTITTFITKAACVVAATGTGLITNADIQASDVVLETAPINIKAADGITVRVGDVFVDPTDVYEVYGPSTPTVVPTVAPTIVPGAVSSINSITGTAQAGKVLTAGTLTPVAATVSYQWVICGTIGGSYTNITGATTNIYTPVSSDVSKYIKVVATGTGNYVGTVSSVATGAIISDEQYFTFAAGTITDYNTAGGSIVIIPSMIGGVAVTHIGNYAFSSKSLVELIIPNSVTSIGEHAFSSNSLQEVIIPDSVETIGTSAFGDNSLASVTIGNSVTNIGNHAFYENQLTSVTIGNSVTSIGEYVFSDNSLVEVIIPDNVTSIGEYAFYENQLTSVTIGTNVTSIGVAAFGDNSLSSVTIGDSVISIGNYAFSDNSLTEVLIPDSVETIGTRAFEYNSLTSVIIGEYVISIGDYAFSPNALKDVTIPDSVQTIGEGAFVYNALNSVTIGKNVISIGNYAFSSNALKEVTIPDSVQTIGEEAFMGNILTLIIIGPDVSIGENLLWEKNNNFREAYIASGKGSYSSRTQEGPWVLE